MPDMAFFQIDNNEKARTIQFRRISDSHHTSNCFASVAYIDADALHTAAKALVASGKCYIYPLPGEGALNAAGVDVTKLENKHTYLFSY